MSKVVASCVVRQRFALLGATGHTGRRILQKLLQLETIPDIEIHVYARSRAKLESLFPSLSSDRRVTIFHGSLSDENLIRNCLASVDTIICTVGENENIPGVTVLRDCAQAVLRALASLQMEEKTWIRPRLLLLSSATWNSRFAASRPIVLDWMIRNAFSRPYSDLVKAQEMFLAATSLVSVLLVQPNALVEEAATGCVISTEFAYIAVSYADLADGFVQLATNPTYKEISAIGVSSQGAKKPFLYIPFALGKVIRGLLFQFVPGYWRAEYAISRHMKGWSQKSKNT
ncbi:hypothetical protein BGW36DRAFT_412685 [Talaromyces proteolyticus]|uniref:NAD(P)-binding domain-containing protein n=1 Tax=Talaromyces proteolyticus TaxID=1131652 RepID=A0AAD4PTZ3_9EURO|nr:uncharacterized protein BGW36DRAFT_412685 [Talaromyces proteolyticus]KAH8688712.1 hypothetical protein BGW36DRAFT_412685 [Talaromyces proteolyticus]